MVEPPAVSEATLRAALEEEFGVPVAALAFLPLGNDLDSFVYRAEGTDESSFLLKARAHVGFRAASLLVPHHLAAIGVPHIVAPLPTRAGALWHDVGAFALSLYPFLDVRTAASAGLDGAQWRALGATLRRIHEAPLPDALAARLPRERFVPSRRDVLDRIAWRLADGVLADPLEREFAAFWRAERATIRAVIEESDALGDALRRDAPPAVLCHADFHGWNVLVDGAGALWIVDWDEVILAPRERDLMFVVGGIARALVAPEESAAFLDGYGGAAIDPRRLRYYRLAWAVQEMGAYAETLFFAPERGAATRREALESFTGLFAAGNIVPMALGTGTD